LWRWAVERLRVRSVLDVGCGEAHAAAFFWELGCEVCAVDGSNQARRDSRVPDAHVVHDFTTGPWKPGRAFDLAWSCEFVEHVESQYEDNFLAAFEAARYVMMTHAAPGQPGWRHVNCQPAAYWAYRLRQHGFACNSALTEESKKLSEGCHYRERGLLFERIPAA
jgi:SAM-dependent methyltransferase